MKDSSNCRTRLISIVSKPILIVVVDVVIDVVFVKQMSCPKKIWLKNIRVQKNFGSKRVRSKKVVVQTNVVQKIKVQKNFGSKKISGPKKFGHKNFLS